MPDRSPVRPGLALFPQLEASAQSAMQAYDGLLKDVFPMKAGHRRRLADNIQELSNFLIDDRKELLGRDYLHAPAALGAYLWYFLPWNLLRLARLLAGADLDLPDKAVIVDIGSGPLTLVQALALARPELLRRELHFYCLDTTPKPMRLGRQLFHGLCAQLGQQGPSRWKIHLEHAPWSVGLGKLPKAHVLTAANFLNELPWHRRDPLGEQVGDFFQNIRGHLHARGQILFVEPGNRYGAKLIAQLREKVVASGWNILAPCTHAQPCPMLDHRETSWCHFSLSTQGCPAWLADISREAQLGKRDMSLSFLHAAAPSEPARPSSGEQGKSEPARIISSEFVVPDPGGGRKLGRYACTARGKLLLVSATHDAVDGVATDSGDLVVAQVADPPRRDAKSRALLGRISRKPEEKGRKTEDGIRKPEDIAGPVARGLKKS